MDKVSSCVRSKLTYLGLVILFVARSPLRVRLLAGVLLSSGTDCSAHENRDHIYACCFKTPYTDGDGGKGGEEEDAGAQGAGAASGGGARATPGAEAGHARLSAAVSSTPTPSHEDSLRLCAALCSGGGRAAGERGAGETGGGGVLET